MKRKSLKMAILLFAMVFLVGAAFAATNGVLTFGGTVRINNSGVTPPPEMGIEFVSVANPSVFPGVRDYLNATAAIVVNEDGVRTLNFDIDIEEINRIPRSGIGSTNTVIINFAIANTGNVPTRLRHITSNVNVPVVPFKITLAEHGQVFNVSTMNNPRQINRVLQPNQQLTGRIDLCAICLHRFLDIYPGDNTDGVFSFSLNLAYDLPADITPSSAEIIEYIAAPVCADV